MDGNEEVLWVEKYRPSRLEDMVDQEAAREAIRGMLPNLPHLLLHGPPGTGKTTAALAVARQLFGESWRENTLELNASDERGLQAVRERVREFARSLPSGGAPFRLVIMDEADNMTGDAQQALRRMMEVHSATARFILIANYVSRIIEPIQSRCAVIRFSPLPREAVVGRLEFIASSEGVVLGGGALDALWEVSGGDLRRAINALQAASSISRKVTAETIYKAMGKASPSVLRAVLHELFVGDFKRGAAELRRLIKDEGVDPLDVIGFAHYDLLSSYSSYKLPEHLKPQLIYLLSSSHYRIIRGSDPLIQLLGLSSKTRSLISASIASGEPSV
mgnify:CR=1 FL=1